MNLNLLMMKVQLNKMDKKHKVLIVGSSGMVGGLILQECLKSDFVSEAIVIVRQKLKINHPKLKQIICQNFMDYSGIEDQLIGIDICYYCLGVYTGAVPKDKFTEITVDYPYALAKTLRKVNRLMNFCLLSGQGADRTEKSFLLFASNKGVIENKLLALGFAHVYCCRPGYIYPDVERQEPNWSYSFIRKLYKPISSIYPNFGIRSIQLAKAMFRIGMSNVEKDLFSNAELRKYNVYN